MRVLLVPLPHEDVEWEAALGWLQSAPGLRATIETPDADTVAPDIVWIHAGDQIPSFSPQMTDSLATLARSRVPFLLSLLATPLAQRIGCPGPEPRVQAPRTWSHEDDPLWPDAFRQWPDYPHVRGFQGWGAHPLFEGLVGGAFTWRAVPGEMVARTWIDRRVPAEDVDVLAVERSYVHLHPEIGVAWEYRGSARVLCLGANLQFAGGDERDHLARDLMVRNALGMASWGAGVAWPPSGQRHARVAPVPRPRPIAPVEQRAGVAVSVSDDVPLALGSEGGLVVGSSIGGVLEAWLYPLGVLGPTRVIIDGEEPTVCSTTASGTHIERHLSSGGVVWREVVVIHKNLAELSYSVEPLGSTDAAVGLSGTLPLRRQWPFAPDALHPLRVEQRRQGSMATILVVGCDERHCAVVFADGVADLEVRADSIPEILLQSEPGKGLALRVRSGSVGVAALMEGLSSVPAASHPVPAPVATQLETDDVDLARGWAAAAQGLKRFMASASVGGRGLLAGFAASRPGWGASRPGYAWFFGRDACWSIDALLVLGRHEEARDAIDLLARTQDPRGKVIHELTLSGVAHYDAADSTPLFLRSIGRYARWTGDRVTLLRWWPHIERAVAHIVSCDRDGDGLPENVGEGHGWVEMGPLGGGAVTGYVASIWVDALRELTVVAEALSRPEARDAFQGLLQQALRGLERLRLPDGTLALHADVNFRLHPSRTALSAVPVALGVEDANRAALVLDALHDPKFLTPWGLRMLSRDHPQYDPAAYHAGAVWPLFTGWLALANAATGRGEEAVDLVRRLIRGAMQAETGAFAEVLDGDTGARRGVCADQAWSAAMAVAPVAEILGLEPDAFASRLAVRAALPASLGRVTLRHLRIGASRLEISLTREGGGHHVTARLADGPPLEVAVGSWRQWVTQGTEAVWHNSGIQDV